MGNARNSEVAALLHRAADAIPVCATPRAQAGDCTGCPLYGHTPPTAGFWCGLVAGEHAAPDPEEWAGCLYSLARAVERECPAGQSSDLARQLHVCASAARCCQEADDCAGCPLRIQAGYPNCELVLARRPGPDGCTAAEWADQLRRLAYAVDLEYYWACRRAGLIGPAHEPPVAEVPPDYQQVARVVHCNGPAVGGGPCTARDGADLYEAWYVRPEDRYYRGHAARLLLCRDCLQRLLHDPEHGRWLFSREP